MWDVWDMWDAWDMWDVWEVASADRNEGVERREGLGVVTRHDVSATHPHHRFTNSRQDRWGGFRRNSGKTCRLCVMNQCFIYKVS